MSLSWNGRAAEKTLSSYQESNAENLGEKSWDDIEGARSRFEPRNRLPWEVTVLYKIHINCRRLRRKSNNCPAVVQSYDTHKFGTDCRHLFRRQMHSALPSDRCCTAPYKIMTQQHLENLRPKRDYFNFAWKEIRINLPYWPFSVEWRALLVRAKTSPVVEWRALLVMVHAVTHSAISRQHAEQM